MSQFGQSQPRDGALMAGPDGVVYAITPAGAVRAAHATPEPLPGGTERDPAGGSLGSPRHMPGIVAPCFSYSPNLPPGLGHPRRMPVTPCFSYSPDLPWVRRMPVGPCFSY